jgi:hypothetical protein
VALPGLCAEAVFASWICLAFVAARSFVAVAALTDTWPLARSMHASFGTERSVAVLTAPSGLADLLAHPAASVVAEEVVARLAQHRARRIIVVLIAYHTNLITNAGVAARLITII